MSKIIFKPLITNYGIVTSVEGWLLIKIRFADKFTNVSTDEVKKVAKVRSCTGTEALYRPYGP